MMRRSCFVALAVVHVLALPCTSSKRGAIQAGGRHIHDIIRENQGTQRLRGGVDEGAIVHDTVGDELQEMAKQARPNSSWRDRSESPIQGGSSEIQTAKGSKSAALNHFETSSHMWGILDKLEKEETGGNSPKSADFEIYQVD
jgi:hypothetical protein